MNERIKRILEQADISMSMTEFSGCFEGQDYLVADSNLSEMQLEKFAELIVRECVDSMEKCFAGGIGTDNNKDVWGPSASTFKAWNGAIKFSRDKIKEHFGVKE